MKYLLILILITIFSSCAPKSEQVIKETKTNDIELQMIEAYQEGVKALESGDATYAAKKFNEAELLFPQSEWAPKSSLMASYAFWTQGYYSNSIGELKRSLRLYPKYQNLDYAYYLLAINYYDSIVDEKKDLRPLEEAKKYFLIIINEYPNTDFAMDANYKLQLIDELLAAKEMYIARHYIKKEKWVASINRLKFVINEYDTTIYVEEALHRLVEINYILGLENEAKKYANILGYNYQSSDWYEKSYKIFNKKYNIVKKREKEDKKEKLLDKIKSFF